VRRNPLLFVSKIGAVENRYDGRIRDDELGGLTGIRGVYDFFLSHEVWWDTSLVWDLFCCCWNGLTMGKMKIAWKRLITWILYIFKRGNDALHILNYVMASYHLLL